MDKFDRRPNRKRRRQKLLLALFAFLVPAIWFGSLIAFGNDAAPWAILGYVALLGGLVVLNVNAYVRRLDLWRASLRVQPEQGPGFSPLEVAALNTILGGTVTGLAGVEVRERYNSGHGCITTLTGALFVGASDKVACFHIRGVDAPVGACLWPRVGADAAMIEFFTRGESAGLDWLAAPFEETPVSPDLARPVMRPVVSEATWKRFCYEG